MGEGSAVVVLEELEHAKRRGAKIYAELIGYGCSSDAYHITSPAEDGSGAATAMLNALKDGGVAPEELTYINAHGTSTHHNDLFETRAIKLAFGEHAYDLKINSTKSMAHSAKSLPFTSASTVTGCPSRNATAPTSALSSP